MFLLFAGSNYYPSGGSQDFKGKYLSIEDAKKWFTDFKGGIEGCSSGVWADITDQSTMKSVAYICQEEPIDDEVWYSSVEKYKEAETVSTYDERFLDIDRYLKENKVSLSDIELKHLSGLFNSDQ